MSNPTLLSMASRRQDVGAAAVERKSSAALVGRLAEPRRGGRPPEQSMLASRPPILGAFGFNAPSSDLKNIVERRKIGSAGVTL
jgi:hypothetical protein